MVYDHDVHVRPCQSLAAGQCRGRLTTYTFDAAGNRTGMQSSLDTVYYTWDAAGRMATAEPVAGIVNFTYNADGHAWPSRAPMAQ